ncbi:MAG: hypothetical protein LC798_21600 [Chloroflexi bacterium]|nr:hypothetical protein [Chloroflexota bacterium]
MDEQLPEGWTLTGTDREVFRLHDADIVTWAAMADGPGGSAMAVVASENESDAVRALQRRILGDLQPTDGWALPVPPSAPLHPDGTTVFADDEDDSEVREAIREAEAALREGWVLYETDREKYSVGGEKVAAWAASAVGPTGEAAMAMGIGEANAIRQLARVLRGELAASDAWAPIL